MRSSSTYLRQEQRPDNRNLTSKAQFTRRNVFAIRFNDSTLYVLYSVYFQPKPVYHTSYKYVAKTISFSSLPIKQPLELLPKRKNKISISMQREVERRAHRYNTLTYNTFVAQINAKKITRVKHSYYIHTSSLRIFVYTGFSTLRLRYELLHYSHSTTLRYHRIIIRSLKSPRAIDQLSAYAIQVNR